MTTARTQGGFTLIELMVAIVVVGILTTIAVPSYQSYVLRANRTVAKAALVDASSRLESYFIVHKSYTNDVTKIQLQRYLKRDSSTSSTQTDAIYDLSISVSGNSYTVSAAPLGVQLKDTSCLTLSLTSTGIRSSSAGTADSCWSR